MNKKFTIKIELTRSAPALAAIPAYSSAPLTFYFFTDRDQAIIEALLAARALAHPEARIRVSSIEEKELPPEEEA